MHRNRAADQKVSWTYQQALMGSARDED